MVYFLRVFLSNLCTSHKSHVCYMHCPPLSSSWRLWWSMQIMQVLLKNCFGLPLLWPCFFQVFISRPYIHVFPLKWETMSHRSVGEWGGTAPLILNTAGCLRWVISLTTPTLNNGPRYPLSRGLFRSQSRSWRFGEIKNEFMPCREPNHDSLVAQSLT